MSESNHISRHLNDELFDFCNSESESISEAGLREIIQRNQLHPTITCGRLSFLQRESHQGNNSMSSWIFLCCWCWYCCWCLVNRSLLMCQQECENGSLPVHYDAYQCRSPEFSCQALIDSAPDSFSRVDNHWYTPLHLLCNKTNKRMEQLQSKYWSFSSRSILQRSGTQIIMAVFQSTLQVGGDLLSFVKYSLVQLQTLFAA